MPTPLTIKSPETLATRLEKMEQQAAQSTTPENNRVTVKNRINGKNVECRSTHTTRNGTYVLFYVDDRRTARSNLPTTLLPQ